MMYIEVYSPPLHAVAVSCLLYIQAVKHCYYFGSRKELALPPAIHCLGILGGCGLSR